MRAETDVQALNALRQRLGNAAGTFFRLAALDLWGNIREEAPVATGRLAGSWEVDQLSTFMWSIHTSVAYAAAVQEGTDPHEIMAVRAKALAFKVDGRLVFARRVRHPGTQPNPYIDRAIDRLEDRLEDFAEQALDQAG